MQSQSILRPERTYREGGGANNPFTTWEMYARYARSVLLLPPLNQSAPQVSVMENCPGHTVQHASPDYP